MQRASGMVPGKQGYAARSVKGRIFMTKRKVLFSRPKDKSLEVYKAWILDMCEHLTGKREDDMSEERWTELWKAFWKE